MVECSRLDMNASWLHIRTALVEKALEEKDDELLSRLAALPGGFGNDETRRKAWLYLLHIKSSPGGAPNATDDLAPHKDEHQVGLDTARSFVTYPKGLSTHRKDALQADLHHLIISVLRRRPKLCYFQGYHDILSVLYLTFSPSKPLSNTRTRAPDRTQQTDRDANDKSEGAGAAQEKQEDEKLDKDGYRSTTQWQNLQRLSEAVSLLRIRDAMGSGMEPMMAMLRLLKRILRAADPDLARLSSRISPVPTLPFFALSWILCLFSHDVDTLQPVQRMFDYLLSRNPGAAVYLAVAILIAKKPQMLRLAKELGAEAADDPTLLHPLFARLPPLYADIPDQIQPPPDPEGQPSVVSQGMGLEKDPNPYDPIPLSAIFNLADDLMLRYPWDGNVVRGKELFGKGSALCTYRNEAVGSGPDAPNIDAMLCEAEATIDIDVIQPDVPDSEEEERVERPIVRAPSNRLGTTIAIGVLLVGLGIAYYGRGKSGAGFWGFILKSRSKSTVHLAYRPIAEGMERVLRILQTTR